MIVNIIIFFVVLIAVWAITSIIIAKKSLVSFLGALIITLIFPIYVKFFNTDFYTLGDTSPYSSLWFHLVFSLQVIFSGNYDHERLDGKRDERYKNNQWNELFDFSIKLWIILLPVCALILFALLDNYVFY